MYQIAVDLGHASSAARLMRAEVGLVLALVQPRAEGPAAEPAGLLARRQPDPHPEPVAGVGDRASSSACSWLRRRRSSSGHEPVGRAGGPAVAVEAGPDERLVGQVVAAEHRGDPLEERRLRQRAGGREQAEHGPLDAVREGRRRGLPVVPVGEPPAAGLDLDESLLGRPAELVADQGEQALDGVVGDLARRRRPARRVRRRVRRATARAADGPDPRGGGVQSGRSGDGSLSPNGPPAPGSSSRAWSDRRPRIDVQAAAGTGPRTGELARTVEPDQDLAEQPLEARRLATGAKRLDRDVRHDAGRLRGVERPLVEALRRREQAGAGDDIRVAGAAGQRRQHLVARGSRARADRAPGGTNSTVPGASSPGSARRATTVR